MNNFELFLFILESKMDSNSKFFNPPPEMERSRERKIEDLYPNPYQREPSHAHSIPQKPERPLFFPLGASHMFNPELRPKDKWEGNETPHGGFRDDKPRGFLGHGMHDSAFRPTERFDNAGREQEYREQRAREILGLGMNDLPFRPTEKWDLIEQAQHFREHKPRDRFEHGASNSELRHRDKWHNHEAPQDYREPKHKEMHGSEISDLRHKEKWHNTETPRDHGEQKSEMSNSDLRLKDKWQLNETPLEHRDQKPEISNSDIRPKEKWPGNEIPQDYREQKPSMSNSDLRPKDKWPGDETPQDYREQKPEISELSPKEILPDNEIPHELREEKPIGILGHIHESAFKQPETEYELKDQKPIGILSHGIPEIRPKQENLNDISPFETENYNTDNHEIEEAATPPERKHIIDSDDNSDEAPSPIPMDSCQVNMIEGKQEIQHDDDHIIINPKIDQDDVNDAKVEGKYEQGGRDSPEMGYMECRAVEEPKKPKVKNFGCGLCERRFYKNASLAEHMRMHTGEKPFSCDVCEKTFAQNSALTRHKRTHTGEKPYECETCQKVFSDSSGLSKHKQRKHGKIVNKRKSAARKAKPGELFDYGEFDYDESILLPPVMVEPPRIIDIPGGPETVEIKLEPGSSRFNF